MTTQGWEVVLMGKWQPYSREESKLFDEALKQGETSVDYSSRGQEYTLDLDAMQQLNKSTGRTRAVRNLTMSGVGDEEDGEVITEGKIDELPIGEGEELREDAAFASTGEPAAKRRKLYRCPLRISVFLKKGRSHTFSVIAPPKQFKGGSYGWHHYKVLKIELAKQHLVVNVTCVMRVIGSQKTGWKKFVRHAAEKRVSFEADPTEFKTGSFGWSMFKKGKLLVDGQMLPVLINLNAVVRGSKPEKPAVTATSEDVEDELPMVDPAPITDDVKALGTPDEGAKDDLKEIAGIGPATEARLNSIGIRTYTQMASMTPEVHEKVMKAIEYFPTSGKAVGSNMVADAKSLSMGRQPVRSRTFHEEMEAVADAD